MEKQIIKERGAVFCNEGAWGKLQEFLVNQSPSKVYVLVDRNTKQHCLPYFLKKYNYANTLHVLTIKAGEAYKNIGTCLELWKQLSDTGADRKSLLINLGGGVVTDLGGFVACTYQRGIEFINIPTSLLAMVDASVGGKNGVDLGALKNQVGIIHNPIAVIVDTQFLTTLPAEHFVSGLAEMIKHGFIYSETYLRKVMSLDRNDAAETAQLIWESIEIKDRIITEDPREQGLRKTLNYGHTLGHAIESYRLKSEPEAALLHGEAIAVGLVLATFISAQLFGFPKKILEETSKYILKTYGKVRFTQEDIDAIIKLLIYDKKNSHGKIQFVLLEDFGKHKLNCEVPNDLIYSAFNFYSNLRF